MQPETPVEKDRFAEERYLIEQRQEKVLFYTRLTVIFLALLLVASFFLEGWSGAPNREITGQPGVTTLSAEFEPELKPEKITDVSNVFPNEMTGYATKARQVVPGSGGRKAEAVYEPVDMNLQLKAPTTVYCEINYFDDFNTMQDFLSRKMSEYPVDQQTLLLEGKTVKTGYSTDRNSYSLFLDEKNYVLWVKALFTVSDPVEKGDYLKIHGTKVMETIIKYMEKVESRAAVDEGEDF